MDIKAALDIAKKMYSFPISQIEAESLAQFEGLMYKISACTGKTKDEIVSFVTGSPISYSDLAYFAAAFVRFPDLHEQSRLYVLGMPYFEDELRVERLSNIASLLKTPISHGL